MPIAPLQTSVGIGRAEPEWACKNKVDGVVGHDNETCADIVSGLDDLRAEYDYLIVGAGLSGSVIARRMSDNGFTCLVIDKRDHIGGNCYDFKIDNGILVSKYGAHLFHTKSERVWNFVKQFSKWTPFDHRVKGKVADLNNVEKIVPIPPTLETVNALFGESLRTDQEMQEWYDRERVAYESPSNGEEAALSRVGPRLYEKIFKHYTKKQWDKYPSELDASVLTRLPCRTSTDDRYFDDAYQALPLHGYTRLFENMILGDKNIDVRVNVDYFSSDLPVHKKLIYTGPIDSYYSQKGLPKLEYRSLRFEEEFIPDADFFQEGMVVNYPSPDVDFTRIVEYKHTPNQPHNVKGTIICREYSCKDGDPYYPVPNKRNLDLYEKYKEMADREEGVIFVGRLASYKYFNMDQAILNALLVSDKLLVTDS